MKLDAIDAAQNHLYLSYAAIDASFALQLVRDLLCAGAPVWVDRLHASRDGWTADLAQALDASRVMIAVLSPHYLQSPYALREVQRAAQRKISIIPVLCAPIERGQWLSELPPAQLIDFVQWHDKRVYRHRLDELLGVLAQKVDMQGKPDAETRYLHTLITRLENKKPLTQFVDLSAEVQSTDHPVRPALRMSAVWGKNVPLFTVDADTRQMKPIASIEAALERFPHFALTGMTGSGKTTAIERFMLDAAYKRLKEGREAPLPIYIDLARWDTDESVEAFVGRCTTFEGETLINFTLWEVILCFDHLDELGEAGAHKAAQIKRWLAGESAPRQAIIACRQADPLLLLDTPQIVIGDLTETNIRHYINACLDGSAAESLLAQFFPRASEDTARAVLLGSLARTSAMLAALVFVFKSSPQSELPLNPGALVKRYFANYWIWKRHASMPGWMPYKEMEAGLHRIARQLLNGQQSFQFTYADAHAAMGDERFLIGAITSGLLEQIDDRLRFRDRLTLEYFAAVGLTLSDLFVQVMSARFDEWGVRIVQSWDGVVILMSGILATADSLIRTVAEIDPYLAGRCIASGVRVSESLYDQVINTLTELAFEQHNRGRVEAAAILRVFSHRLGMNALFDVMRGGVWRERQAASHVVQHGKIQFSPALFEHLSHWNWQPSDDIAAALMSLGVEALPMLLNLLQDSQWQHRRGAAWALGAMDDCAALPGLVDALSDQRMEVRVEAAKSIGRLKDPAAVPFLVRCTQDAQWEIREAAAEALDVIGAPKVLHMAQELPPPAEIGEGDSLIDALNHENWQVRCSAVGALAQIPDSSVVPALMEALHDDDARVRHAAIKGLELHPDQAVIEALLGALHDPERFVVEAAMRVLEAFGVVTTVPDEGYADADTIITVDEQPLYADIPIAQVSEVQWEGLRDLLESLAQSNWHARRESARVLREQAKHLRGVADSTVTDLLIDSLRNPDYVVRWAVVEALAWIKAASAVPNLLYLLRDPSWTVRTAVIRALLEIGDSAAVPALVDSLDDEHPMVRETAAEALGRLRSEMALPALMDHLHDSEPFVRRAAAVAVGIIREAGLSSVQSLMGLLDDPDPQVRWAAVESLGTLRDPFAVRALISRLGDTYVPMWETRRICDVVAEALLAIGEEDGVRAVEQWRLGQLT